MKSFLVVALVQLLYARSLVAIHGDEASLKGWYVWTYVIKDKTTIGYPR